jgi:hypothetical protein
MSIIAGGRKKVSRENRGKLGQIAEETSRRNRFHPLPNIFLTTSKIEQRSRAYLPWERRWGQQCVACGRAGRIAEQAAEPSVPPRYPADSDYHSPDISLEWVLAKGKGKWLPF